MQILMSVWPRNPVKEHAQIRSEAICVPVPRVLTVTGRKMVLVAIPKVQLMAIPCSTLPQVILDHRLY